MRRLRCKDCKPGRYCDYHRKEAARHAAAYRARKGRKARVCFRCQSDHPVGERYCPLAAEYQGATP